MQEKQLVVDETLINYIELNPEASEALVFLHGWQSSAEAWMGVLSKLKEKNIHLLALDLPGFGKSPLPPAAWGVGDYARVVKNFLLKKELSQVILIGHSFGGRVAIKLAATAPSVLKKLVLVDAAGFRDNSLNRALKVRAAEFLKPLFNLSMFKSLKPLLYEAIGASDYGNSAALKQIFIKTIEEDLSVNMTEVQVPTLLVWGEFDYVTPLSFAHRMSKLIPNSQLMILPEAGHFSFVDQPDKFVEAIQSLV